MLIAVFGATGRTGRAVVGLAQSRGHRVVAAARSAADVAWPDGVEGRATDILDAADVERVCHGVDAAIVAVGTPRGPTTVYSAGVTNVLTGLSAAGANRLAVVSALPAGPRNVLPARLRLACRFLDRFLAATYQDMRDMERVLAGSDAAWVCLRPPRLVARPVRGAYRLSESPLGGSIAHADLAAALLDVLEESTWQRRFGYVSLSSKTPAQGGP